MIDEEIEFENNIQTFEEYLEDEINYCKQMKDKREYNTTDYWYWQGRVEALQLARDTYKAIEK